MRYLLLLTTDAAPGGGAPGGGTPPPGAALQRFTVELINAGVLLAGEQLAADGLDVEHAVDGSCRVVEAAGEAHPFALWIVQASDRAEAVEWARRLPVDRGRVEVRRIVSGAAAEA